MTAEGVVIYSSHGGAIPSSDAPRPGTTPSGFSFPGIITAMPTIFTGSDFVTQLKSTIQRQLLQKRRKWRSCAVEMLLPILFVIGLMAISSVSTRTDVPAKQYISPTGPQELGKMIRSQHLCYNPRAANAELVDLLQPCSNVTSSTLTCLQPSSNLPVSGLCITSGLDGIKALALSIINAEQDMEVPNYNEYVLMKWALSGLPDSDDLFSGAVETARQSGQIYVTPQSSASTSFVKYMNESFSLFKFTFGAYFSSRQDATAFSTDVTNEGKTWAIIGINQADSNGLDFVLSMNRTAQVVTGSRNRFVNGLGGKTYAKYVASGALTLQKSVNDYYITKVLNSNAVETYPVGASSHTVVAPMPIEKYVDDEFLSIAASLGPLLLVLAFLYPVSQLAKRLVEEKEQRLREGTMIMGLSKRAFFASWLIVYYVQMAIVSFVIAILISSSIATQSNFLIIFIPYLLFSLTTVNLSALLSTLFAKSKIAALCVPLLYFVFAIPAFSLSEDSSPAIFSLLSFLCPVPFSLALKLIFSYEINNGLGWNSAFSSTDEPYNIAVAIVFLCVDFVLYFALMAYLDMVIPKEWGTTKHPLFFIMKFFRKKEAHDDNVAHQVDGGIDNPKNHLTKIGRLSALQDYPMPNDQSTVHIRQLRKEFPGAGGRVNVAVDGMELRMFPDTVTVFLGHNGAGKTTVMNMMTGMLSPTSGDVTIYGNSILTNLQAVRRDIGFCPQHNILWDDLTCMEHLQYFARLKGMKGADVDNESIEMLTKVDLLDKKDVFSANLSGGQKRKLSVAIAFMGKARLVLLDEPTAGMDVAARRHTWDVLKEMSKGRTILLTTHFMDEADLLGSRIAIMSKGSLNSYGSPMYLKNNLGSGYVMRLAASTMIADPQPILAEIRRIIPSAHIREAKGQEVAISLPKDEARLFPSVIRTMDAAATKARLNYNSISLSVASLEDVFLAIAHQEATDGAEDAEESASADEAKVAASFAALEKVYLKVQQQQQMLGVAQENKNTRNSDGANFSSAIEMQSTGAAAAENNSRPLTVGSSGTFGRQLSGMLMKRINHGRRDYCSLCLQIAAPLLCIFVALVLGQSGGTSDPSQTFYSNKELYGSVQQVISTNNCSSNTDWDSDFASVDSQYLPSTLSFSNHLLSTYNSHGDRERMVSFSCNDKFANTVLMANATGSFTAPQALNQYYRNVARQVSSGKATITVSQWPLPYTERQTAGIDSISALFVALFILIPFTFIPSTFVAFVVRERQCKSKHLQFVSGANYGAYWLGNFIFDLVSYLVTVVIAFLLFAIFSQDWAVGSGDAFFGTFFLFLLYGLSAIGFAYLVSFLFEEHSAAQTVVMMMNFLVGFLLVLIMYFLRNIESTETMAKVLVYFLRVVPPFALGDGLFQMVMSSAMSSIAGGKSPFDMDVAGLNMLYMAIFSFVFLAATMFIDHPSRQKRREMLSFKSTHEAPKIENEDVDVALERKEVESGQRLNDVVQVQGLRKEFDLPSGKKKIAVQNITFGVKPGEVFGFLGTNGAGKTTTMSKLTTEILPSCGHGRIGGFDIVQRSDMTRRLIGYCPQFDAIMDLLTPAEHLRLFAALRGISISDSQAVIDALITSCALEKYRDIPAGSLSGGNKRKLSVAMALIGGPSIVFLDEPSAGMDPHARRQLWDVIIFIAKRSSVVLTTHHLEEVDVLAHRVGIMDQGLMKCLGSLEHLKRKFGSGFELTIQVSEQGQSSASAFIKNKYPASVLVEARQQRILYTLPFESTDLASLFETIQRATDDPSIGIIDYTVQQTSLEQVFMRITELGEASQQTSEAASPQSVVPDPYRNVE